MTYASYGMYPDLLLGKIFVRIFSITGSPQDDMEGICALS